MVRQQFQAKDGGEASQSLLLIARSNLYARCSLRKLLTGEYKPSGWGKKQRRRRHTNPERGPTIAAAAIPVRFSLVTAWSCNSALSPITNGWLCVNESRQPVMSSVLFTLVPGAETCSRAFPNASSGDGPMGG